MNFRVLRFIAARAACCGMLAVTAGACGRARPELRPEPHAANPSLVTATSQDLPAGGPEAPAPSGERPVTASARVRPAAVTPGRSAELCVQVRVAPGHYLHGRGAKPPFTKASVEVSPAADVIPNAAGDGGLDGGLEGTAAAAERLGGVIEFRRPFAVARDAPAGPREIACVLTYQVCNAEACWPLATMELRAKFFVSSRSAEEEP